MFDVIPLGQAITADFQRHPIVAAVMGGQLSRAQYARYIIDVYHYARHSAVVIGQAGVRLVHSHPALAAYFLRHAHEELGHDAWAHSDLIDIGLSPAAIVASQPSPPCRDMIEMEYYFACNGNPVGLFGWTYVLECLGGGMGGAMAAGIDRALRLNGKGVWFLSGHGDADSQHMVDLAQIINAHVAAAEDRACFLAVVDRARGLYRGILDAALAAGTDTLAVAAE